MNCKHNSSLLQKITPCPNMVIGWYGNCERKTRLSIPFTGTNKPNRHISITGAIDVITKMYQ